MAKLTPLSEKSVVGLLEGLSRRSTKKFTPFYSVVLNAPFCPVKQKLRKKQSEVSMVKIPQHKVTKFNKFFSGSFFVFFEQSDKTFTAAFWMELEFYFACGKILLTEKGRYAFSDQQPKTFFLFPLCKV